MRAAASPTRFWIVWKSAIRLPPSTTAPCVWRTLLSSTNRSSAPAAAPTAGMARANGTPLNNEMR